MPYCLRCDNLLADFDAPRDSTAAVPEACASQPSAPAEEAKLSVWIQDGRRPKKKFKVRRTDPLSKLMRAVKSNLVKGGILTEADTISFSWEERLQPDDTPADLDWGDDEVVDIKW